MKIERNKKRHTPPQKKEWKSLELSVPLPNGVSATYNAGVLSVKGPLGEVSKKLRYPGVTVEVAGQAVLIKVARLSQMEKKLAFTYEAHAKNMIKGVEEGFEYNLRVVYAKFPISAEVKGNKFVIKNFLGEKVPRMITIPDSVKVVVKGAEISVKGIDKEIAGQVAANIEQLTRITRMDRRVIQDGVYIIKKPHRTYVE